MKSENFSLSPFPFSSLFFLSLKRRFDGSALSSSNNRNAQRGRHRFSRDFARGADLCAHRSDAGRSFLPGGNGRGGGKRHRVLRGGGGWGKASGFCDGGRWVAGRTVGG